MPRISFLQCLGTVVLWFGATWMLLGAYPRDPNLDHDEIYWLGSTYYYDLVFVKHDWSNAAWSWLPARENPPVAKYVLGAGLAVAGQPRASVEPLSYFYLYWMGWEKSPDAHATNEDGLKRQQVIDAAGPQFRRQIQVENHAPITRKQVQAGRSTVLVCALLTSMLVLLIGVAAGRGMTGLLASLLLLAHPAMVAASSHAMADTIGLMFAVAAAWLLFYWYRLWHDAKDGGESPGILQTAAVGLTLGLACGAKMNSLVVVILGGGIVITTGLSSLVRHDRAGAARIFLQGLLIVAVAFTSFILINPAIIRDISGGLAATVLEHRRTELLQADVVLGRLDTPAQRIATVVRLAYFGWIPFSLFAGVIAALGFLRWKQLEVRFFIAWWMVAMICVTLWIPFPWTRYILPVVPPTVLLVGSALAELIQSLRRRSVLRDR